MQQPRTQRTGSVSGFTAQASGGTEFMSTLPPPRADLDGWDSTQPWNQQSAPNLPLLFKDAMSVREPVFGEQGVPLAAEFDPDDPRSWHWVVYASVGTSPAAPPKSLARSDSGNTPADDARRASATAHRLPVGTLRLVPPPHGPDPYLPASHRDPPEPYVKLGRLAVLAPYRNLALSKLLINAALDFAATHPHAIYTPPSPTTRELAALQGPAAARPLAWRGLVMVHAQSHLKPMWEKHGFREALLADDGALEIAAQDPWLEEGIEHVGMWKRVRVSTAGW